MFFSKIFNYLGWGVFDPSCHPFPNSSSLLHSLLLSPSQSFLFLLLLLPFLSIIFISLPSLLPFDWSFSEIARCSSLEFYWPTAFHFSFYFFFLIFFSLLIFWRDAEEVRLAHLQDYCCISPYHPNDWNIPPAISLCCYHVLISETIATKRE